MELREETKAEIAEIKLEQWKQKLYSLELDVKVAKVIDDKVMLDAIKPEIKKCVAALEVLGEEIQELTEKK